MPFESSEMRKVAAEYGFAINTSSPEHAASNGQSERMIGTVMRKANEDSRDPHLALLEHTSSGYAIFDSTATDEQEVARQSTNN